MRKQTYSFELQSFLQNFSKWRRRQKNLLFYLELEWFIFQSKFKVYNQEKLLFKQILFHDFSVSCPFH